MGMPAGYSSSTPFVDTPLYRLGHIPELVVGGRGGDGGGGGRVEV